MQAAEVVKLRVFAGMTVEEVAEHLGVSPRTAKRSWAYACAWLGRELSVHPGLEPWWGARPWKNLDDSWPAFRADYALPVTRRPRGGVRRDERPSGGREIDLPPGD